MATSNDDREIFENLTSKLSGLHFDRKTLYKTLEDLHSLNYRNVLVENPTKAVLLINNFCTSIRTDEEVLIPKCCQLITNLVIHQKVIVEGRTLSIAIQWCLKILSIFKKENILTLDVLIALEALLRSNSQNIQSFISEIVSPNGPISKLLETDISPEVLRYCLQCIESCTAVQENNNFENKLEPYFEKCISIFTKYLCNPRNLQNNTELKIIIVCLRGLENIALQNNEVIIDKLGVFLGIIKSYMLLGIKNCDFLQPRTVLPSALSIPEPSNSGIHIKKGGKVAKQRKPRVAKKEESRKCEEWMKSTINLNIEQTGANIDKFSNTFPKSSTSQMITSDSDFSDNEANRTANTFKLQSRVRQMSLSLFLTLAKNTEKSMMFSFWSSFIPENSLSGKHYLTTCILEDPSPRGRIAALNILVYILTTSKLYLFQAESSSRSTAFTPFSVVLGYMITELHHYLSLALCDKVVPVLAQVLKCYAALVQASPYHRLNAGLITKVIRSMKQFIRYKDPTIQVGALIVIGCVLASEPVVPETKYLFLEIKNKEMKDICENDPKNSANKEDFSYAEFSSDEENEDSKFDDEYKVVPWILEKCLKNSLVAETDNNIPAPVKLESVQVISSMCRNYFEWLVYPYLSQIGKALNDCLSDKCIDLKLHSGRAIDFIGQSMEQYLSGLDVCSDEMVAAGLTFWQILLNGSLTPLLQWEQQPTIQAVGCDCLASIGSHIFGRLPGDKQILCVTLLFACSRDKENSIRGAALRALGIFVLYPTLREDPGFVADTAEIIYRSLQDESLGVRIKSYWSLGNLSDTLVLNSTNDDLEQLPHSLLLKLLEKCTVTFKENDKIKMNVVRTIGNLLQLIRADIVTKHNLKYVVDSAVNCLINTASHGSNMKVRWNSCYAIGNVLKNSALYDDRSEWLGNLFGTLSELVTNCVNFKVRINAALAFSSPSERRLYGSYYYKCAWPALLRALQTSQNIDELSEYRHRDRLVEQICLALGHLISLLDPDDLRFLYEDLNQYLNTLKCQMKRVNQILIPEKSNIFFAAAIHLKTIGNSNISTEAAETLKTLKDIFVQEF